MRLIADGVVDRDGVAGLAARTGTHRDISVGYLPNSSGQVR